MAAKKKTKKKAVEKAFTEAKNLTELLKKKGADVTLGFEDSTLDVPLWISTGSTVLDGLLTSSFDPSLRGIPIGRIIDVIGPPGAGKSTIMAHVCRQVQLAGGISVILASEGERCKERLEFIGLNPERHITVVVNDVLDGFYWIASLTQNKNEESPMVIVWDTISSAPDPGNLKILDAKDHTEMVKAASSYSSGQCSRARIIRDQIRNITNVIHRCRATVIFVHQTIERPQAARSWLDFQPQSSGGRAIPFQSSLRLYVAGGAKWKEGDETVGILSRVKTFKSKLVMPEREVIVPIRFRSGIDDAAGVVEYLAHPKVGFIKSKGGGWRSFERDGEEKNFKKAELSLEDLSYLREEVFKRMSPCPSAPDANLLIS